MWLGIAISVICLAIVFIIVKPADILKAISQANPWLLLITMITLVIYLFIRAIRWRFMLVGGWSNQRSLPYWTVFHIQNIGYMLSNILPFRLGDVIRAILIGNVPPVTISQGFSTMVAERVFDLLFMVVLFPLALAMTTDVPTEIEAAVRFAGLLALIALIILILAANSRQRSMQVAESMLKRISFLNSENWTRRLDDLLLGLKTLTSWKDGFTLLILSILVWIPIFAGYYTAMLAVNLDVSLWESIFVVCIAAFSYTAPSSPGQIGVFEAAVTFALAGLLDKPDDLAASFAFINHAINYLVIGILGVIGIFGIGSTFSNVIDTTRSLIRSRS